MHTDTLIHASWIIPVEPENQVLEQHSLAINQGRIQALLPTAEAKQQIQAEQIIDLPGHALIPGLINAHTHSPMTLFRGLADDLPLMTWLNEHIWPAEQRWVREEFVSAGTRLAVAEMLRGGTTCFSDMYFFADTSAQVAAEAGMRMIAGLILIDFPSAWAQDANEYFVRAQQLHDQLKDRALIDTAFTPHSPYAVGDESLARLARLTNELDLPVHMHVHETADEVRQGLEQGGERPLARLGRLGLLSPNLVAVHMTQLEDAEIEQIAHGGCQVVHCPQSNLKLASGFCPVARLAAAGINVALGTDGAASNNDLDMFNEMQTAALLGKGLAGDPSALPAHQVLEMATINAARAYGLADRLGSLVVGKSADLVAVDLSSCETQPVYHPISQLIYAAGREQVRHVWIAGEQVLRDRQLTRLDLDLALQQAGEWRKRLLEFW